MNQLTPETAIHLGLAPTTPGLDQVVEAAYQWGLKRRCLTSPDSLRVSPDWTRGVVLYAALLWQKRAMPQGFPGYDSDVPSLDLSGALGDIYKLVGLDPVVA